MIENFVLTFREVLDNFLVMSIVLSFLTKTKQDHYKKWVWFGFVSGIVASLIGAYLFQLIAGGFTGTAEEIFEGTVMIIGAILISTMVIWMAQQKHIARELQDKMSTLITNSQKWGIFLLVFTAILREGIELVIFLGVAGFVTSEFAWLGTLLGFVTAGLLSYLFYIGTIKLNLKILFNITTTLLISFAAGLVAHGIHEFQEAGVIPFIYYPLYNINPIIDENGLFGSIIKGLFGYNGNPSLIEVIAYFAYLISISIIWYKISNRKIIAIKSPKTETPNI